jgi:hypothetical protein
LARGLVLADVNQPDISYIRLLGEVHAAIILDAFSRRVYRNEYRNLAEARARSERFWIEFTMQTPTFIAGLPAAG